MAGTEPLHHVPFDPAVHLRLLESWLAVDLVAQWWPDSEHQLEQARHRPPGSGHRLLMAGDAPIGYARWQKVGTYALAAAGLTGIPAGSVDLDILIGEGAFVGKGLGPAAVRLLYAELLRDESIPLVGMVTSTHNRRAIRAFEKAGLERLAEYDDERYGQCAVLACQRATIQIASRAEADDAISLLTRQLAEHEIDLGQKLLERAVLAILDDCSKGLILLARHNAQSVGVACLARTFTLEHGGYAWWLDELYVLPDRRSHYIGTQLLARAVALASQAGAVAMELEVESTHGRAARLYARAGFSALSRQRWSLSLTRRDMESP